MTSSDCDPAQHLRDKQVSLQTYNEGRNLFSWMQNAAAKRPPSTIVLPLLSANRQLIKEYTPRVRAQGKAGTSTLLQPKQPQPPGSMTHLWMWLSEGVELLFGTRVWLIGQICTDFGISDWRTYCWSVLVSTKQGGANGRGASLSALRERNARENKLLALRNASRPFDDPWNG